MTVAAPEEVAADVAAEPAPAQPPAPAPLPPPTVVAVGKEQWQRRAYDWSLQKCAEHLLNNNPNLSHIRALLHIYLSHITTQNYQDLN